MDDTFINCMHRHLRNKFKFLNVHGIMNTSGANLGFTLTLQETRSIHDSANRSKIEFIFFIFTIYYKYLKHKKKTFFFNLGIKTVLYFKYNRFNGLSECKTEKRNSQLEQGQPMEQTRGLFCMCDSGVARFQLQHQCHFW